jgi:hypothetical protein
MTELNIPFWIQKIMQLKVSFWRKGRDSGGYATRRKVAGSSPDEEDFFQFT